MKNVKASFLQSGYKFNRIFIIMLTDICMMALAYFIALIARFNFTLSQVPALYLSRYFTCLIAIAISGVFALGVTKGYRVIWRFASAIDLKNLVKAFVLQQIILFAIAVVGNQLTGDAFYYMPRTFWIIGAALEFAGLSMLRFSYRFVRDLTIADYRISNKDEDVKRVLIIGAGSAGRLLIRELQENASLHLKPICIVDDNPNIQSKYINNVQVQGTRKDIPELVKKNKINNIILAIPSLSNKEKQKILAICQETSCKISILPNITDLVKGGKPSLGLKDVSLVDLLGRDPVQIDNAAIHSFITGKRVLVTGGGGSIGSELCRQIAQDEPEQLIIFDIYENNAYAIEQELKRQYPNLNLLTLIGSIRDKEKVDKIFETYKPDMVYHAAAHKHVPLMQTSPHEAIKNNVFGTYNVADAALKYGTKRFLLISTDKAVNPTNIMGASKRLCEMIVQMMDRRSQQEEHGYVTKYSAVRFGNVLGSNGSVVPLFKRQIAEGGPVTVTDKRIVRYFMTIPEAVSLVLQSSYYARGGEIFVLDMGDPVKIDDMARNLIRLSGYEPDVDIKIVYTGLRPGEKLYEEMLMSEEGLRDTDNNLIHIGEPISMDDERFMDSLSKLKAVAYDEDSDIIAYVDDMLPTYHPEMGA